MAGTAETPTPASPALDRESQAWIDRLRRGSQRETAVRELHVLLLKATRFEVARRAGAWDRGEREDIAQQAADDALVALLAKLDRFRGDSRFTTWAYKFALYEAAASCRRHSWREREIPLEPELWPLTAAPGRQLSDAAETNEVLAALSDAIEKELSAHQRRVLVAVALNGVPIDVLAERWDTTRGALYKTLHDARAKLRASLAARGLHVDARSGGDSR